MNELIQKLQDLHGLSTDQSKGILTTISGYIKEKYPMVGGAIDNIFPPDGAATADGAATTDSASAEDGGLLDKISDFVPGATGQKIEDFAKDKLGGFFDKK